MSDKPQPIIIFNNNSSQADGFAEDTTVLTVNTFCNRQTKESPYSHYEGTQADLLDLIAENWYSCKPGYRTGVVLVTVPPEGFYSSICRLQPGDTLQGSYKPRRSGEEPRKTLGIPNGQKLAARLVEVVLYNSPVLAEDGSNELPAESGNWEVVSINASPWEGGSPMHPSTLMHNHFGSSGGTKTNLTDEEFCAILKHSFMYWKDKAMLIEEQGNDEH